MGDFDYIILLDIDEVLMPMLKNISTIPELIEKLDGPQFSGFNFENVFLEKDENYVENRAIKSASRYDLGFTQGS